MIAESRDLSVWYSICSSRALHYLENLPEETLSRYSEMFTPAFVAWFKGVSRNGTAGFEKIDVDLRGRLFSEGFLKITAPAEGYLQKLHSLWKDPEFLQWFIDQIIAAGGGMEGPAHTSDWHHLFRNRLMNSKEDFSNLVEQTRLLLEFDFSKTLEIFAKKLKHRQEDDHSFPGTPQRMERDLYQYDPTPHHEYCRWILQVYANRGIDHWDDLPRARTALEAYNQFKVRRMLPPEGKDILQIKTLVALEDLVDSLSEDPQDKIARPDTDPVELARAKKESELVYSDKDVVVITPKTPFASSFWGDRTSWCTARKDGGNLFQSYNSRGPLYIFIPRIGKNSNEKYQLHLTNNMHGVEFKDIRDRPISVADFIAEHPWAKNAYTAITGISFDQNVQIETWKGMLSDQSFLLLHQAGDKVLGKYRELFTSGFVNWFHSAMALLRAIPTFKHPIKAILGYNNMINFRPEQGVEEVLALLLQQYRKGDVMIPDRSFGHINMYGTSDDFTLLINDGTKETPAYYVASFKNGDRPTLTFNAPGDRGGGYSSAGNHGKGAYKNLMRFAPAFEEISGIPHRQIQILAHADTPLIASYIGAAMKGKLPRVPDGALIWLVHQELPPGNPGELLTMLGHYRGMLVNNRSLDLARRLLTGD